MNFKKKNHNFDIDEESVFSNLIKKYKIIIFFIIMLILVIVSIFIFLNIDEKNEEIPLKEEQEIFLPPAEETEEAKEEELEPELDNYLTLLGDDYMILPKGTEYNDPGYMAYNSNGDDLNTKVIINSSLDINKIGEYQITYSLGNITKIRKIKVIDIVKGIASIYLKPVNGDVNVYLEVGDKYQEPGYRVFADDNTYYQVSTTGVVDTSKVGTYTLIYAVEDSNGNQITVTRTVEVMDIGIKVSLDNTKPTKDNVSINVEVNDKYFDYIILPNKERTTKNKYTYAVKNNGKYTFTVYNKKGMKKTKSIQVSNIDKKLPVASCSGYYKDGKSVITIKAEDNLGISKYIINGKEYTKQNITLNKEYQNITVEVYDKVNNVSKISCKLTNKNSSKKSNTDNDFLGTKYNLTNSQLKGLAMLCQSEQGTAVGAAAEASLIANRFELYGSSYGSGGKGLYNYARKSGWWAYGASHMDNQSNLSSSVLSAVKDVLVNGNRTLPHYVDEHDCIDCGYYGFDIKKIVKNGVTITSHSGLLNHDNYIMHKTVIYNVYGAVYTFYSFPTPSSDPFGYTNYAKKQYDSKNK